MNICRSSVGKKWNNVVWQFCLTLSLLHSSLFKINLKWNSFLLLALYFCKRCSVHKKYYYNICIMYMFNGKIHGEKVQQWLTKAQLNWFSFPTNSLCLFKPKLYQFLHRLFMKSTFSTQFTTNFLNKKKDLHWKFQAFAIWK